MPFFVHRQILTQPFCPLNVGMRAYESSGTRKCETSPALHPATHLYGLHPWPILHPRLTRHTEPGAQGFRLHGVVTSGKSTAVCCTRSVWRSCCSRGDGSRGAPISVKAPSGTQGPKSGDSRAQSAFADIPGAEFVQSKHVLNSSRQSSLQKQSIINYSGHHINFPNGLGHFQPVVWLLCRWRIEKMIRTDRSKSLMNMINLSFDLKVRRLL